MSSSLTVAWQDGRAEKGAPAGGLERALAAFVARARAARPEISLADDLFLRTVARTAGTSDPEKLDALHAADLLVARGALAGDAAAIGILEKELLPVARAAAAGLDSAPAFADDVRQTLREKLLIGRETGPSLATYSGLGPLAAWIRISARRIALNLLEARSERRASDEDELLAMPSPDTSPELRLLRERSQGEIKRAVHESMAALQVRERLMLRMHYLDGVSMTQIARSYGLHQSNVSRTIQSAREQLTEGTRRLLAERLRLPASELESLIGLVSSGLDLSLSRALRSESNEPGASTDPASSSGQSAFGGRANGT